MLDLHAGVHLDEVEAPVLVQELERAGAAVADAHAGFGADLADLGPLFVGDAGRGRFLDHLLVAALHRTVRSEEHTSELQSLMRISYAVFCLKKKKKIHKLSNIERQS